MVNSKTEPKSVTFKKNAELRSQGYSREEPSRRNGQEESESELTSDSTLIDSRGKDSFCVRKDVYKMIQKMAETSATDSNDEASSVSSVMEMVPKDSNEATGPRSELDKRDGGTKIRVSKEAQYERKCACRERTEVPLSTPLGNCICNNEKRQSEDATQTEDLAYNAWTCLCHNNTFIPTTIPGHLATMCNENRYHRMHISQITPHDCACVPGKESCTSLLEPMSKKMKKRKKLFPYCRSSTTSIQHEPPLPGPGGIPVSYVNQTQSTEAIKPMKEEIPERMDIYYFDHGNSGYYRTTDRPPAIYADILMDAADETATKFWADIFGALHIGFAFIIHFVLQLLRFLLYSILRPLTVGVFQLIADYYFKPLLTVLFNGLLQPILILFYNIATSIRDLCEPLAAAIGFFLKELASLLRSFRIVEVQKIECCHAHKII